MAESKINRHIPYGQMSIEQKKELSNRYVEDFLNSPFYATFIVHRRVMTRLYKAYAINGYEIELLLVICKLCDWEEGKQITGTEIRKRCSRRFQAVLMPMLQKLVYMEFITDTKKPEDSQQKGHRIGLAPKGVEFVQLWRNELDTLIQYERDTLIMTTGKKRPKEGGNSKIRENKV